MRTNLILGLLAFAGGTVPSAVAQIVTFQFTGTITSNYAPGVGDPLFAAAFPVGSTYTASYSYDANKTDVDGRSTVGIFLGGPSDNFNSTLIINGNTFADTHMTAQVMVIDSQPNAYGANTADGVVFNYGGFTTSGGFNLTARIQFLYSLNLGLFSSDGLSSLTANPISVSDFNLLHVAGFQFSGGRSLDASIDSVSVSAVPEPATWTVIAAAAALAAAVWRRRWMRTARTGAEEAT